MKKPVPDVAHLRDSLTKKHVKSSCQNFFNESDTSRNRPLLLDNIRKTEVTTKIFFAVSCHRAYNSFVVFVGVFGRDKEKMNDNTKERER